MGFLVEVINEKLIEVFFVETFMPEQILLLFFVGSLQTVGL
jgi:hypothetical protein